MDEFKTQRPVHFQDLEEVKRYLRDILEVRYGAIRNYLESMDKAPIGIADLLEDVANPFWSLSDFVSDQHSNQSSDMEELDRLIKLHPYRLN